MRLIDADEFEDALENTEYDISPAYEPDGYSHRLICKVLEETPTVDAVPVIRCRECKNWKPYGSKAARKIGDPLERYGGCEIWHGGHLESDFCSNGQRRDQSADVRNIGQFASPGKTGGQNDADQH